MLQRGHSGDGCDLEYNRYNIIPIMIDLLPAWMIVSFTHTPPLDVRCSNKFVTFVLRVKIYKAKGFSLKHNIIYTIHILSSNVILDIQYENN